MPRAADVGGEYVDPGDVEADHPRRPLDERPVVGIDRCGDVFDRAESIAAQYLSPDRGEERAVDHQQSVVVTVDVFLDDHPAGTASGRPVEGGTKRFRIGDAGGHAIVRLIGQPVEGLDHRRPARQVGCRVLGVGRVVDHPGVRNGDLRARQRSLCIPRVGGERVGGPGCAPGGGHVAACGVGAPPGLNEIGQHTERDFAGYGSLDETQSGGGHPVRANRGPLLGEVIPHRDRASAASQFECQVKGFAKKITPRPRDGEAETISLGFQHTPPPHRVAAEPLDGDGQRDYPASQPAVTQIGILQKCCRPAGFIDPEQALTRTQR